MAYDRDETEYTLTEDGWKVGADRDFGIEIWIRNSSQASGWSREHISWSCIWANGEVEKEERYEIRNKHKEFMGYPGRDGNRETTIGRPL